MKKEYVFVPALDNGDYVQLFRVKTGNRLFTYRGTIAAARKLALKGEIDLNELHPCTDLKVAVRRARDSKKMWVKSPELEPLTGRPTHVRFPMPQYVPS